VIKTVRYYWNPAGANLIHSHLILPPIYIYHKRCLLREIGWDGVDWVDLAQDRDHWRALVNTVMNLRVP
jgi:hypothetical protein